jgi:hypothetical protein
MNVDLILFVLASTSYLTLKYEFDKMIYDKQINMETFFYNNKLIYLFYKLKVFQYDKKSTQINNDYH